MIAFSSLNIQTLVNKYTKKAMKNMNFKIICLSLLLQCTSLYAEEEATKIPEQKGLPFDISLSLMDYLNTGDSSVYSGNLKFEYSPTVVMETQDHWLTQDRWIYKLEHTRNINRLELKNRTLDTIEKINFQSTKFTLQYKMFRSFDDDRESVSFGPSLAVNYINFSKSDGTLFGVGGWLKFPISFFDISKKKRIDLEAIYYVDKLNSRIDLDTSYFLKSTMIIFVSDSYYTKFGLGYESLELRDKNQSADLGINSPFVDIGLGHTF
jgi:hypothetical protein